jgi:chorismate mutase
MGNNIIDIRKEFDETDSKILNLVARRMQLSKSIAGLKKDSGISVIQPDIWRQQMRQRKKDSGPLQVNEAFVVKLFSLIHDESVRVQNEILELTT